MGKQLLHTPEGVRDIYGEEYTNKLVVQDLFHKTLKSYGFMDIQTPTFEFFDVFSKEVGTTSSKELYKFFDKEGNTLVLRPDFTPSIARCATKYFMNDLPIRLCYEGNTFTNTSNLQGRLKEVTQMGAELIGDHSVEADGEMISLVVESLLHTGLKDFQISIGQAEFFKGLCEEVGLDEEIEFELRELISNKNYFGAEDLLEKRGINKAHSSKLLRVTAMFGSIEDLKKVKELITNDKSIQAISRLERLYEVLCLYNKEAYISFDLGMLSKYNYYTGIIFKAYTYGVGDAIVTGGRYDKLLQCFGKGAPAIGFVAVIDDVMAAISRQKIQLPKAQENIVVIYQSQFYKEALKKTQELRNKGENVELVTWQDSQDIASYRLSGKTRNIGTIIAYSNSQPEEIEVHDNK